MNEQKLDIQDTGRNTTNKQNIKPRRKWELLSLVPAIVIFAFVYASILSSRKVAELEQPTILPHVSSTEKGTPETPLGSEDTTFPGVPSVTTEKPIENLHKTVKTEAQINAENCHEYFTKGTAQNREEFAESATSKLGMMDVIFMSARGEDNMYLLVSTSPQNEAVLQQVAQEMTTSISIRGNLCLKGFAEMQFIIRDENFNQRLLSKFQLNAADTIRAMYQLGNAAPIE